MIISAHRLSALTEANEILVLQHGHIAQRGQHEQLAEQPGWYRDMYRYQQLEAALDDARNRMRRTLMRKTVTQWPTLKRLLAYGSPWRKPLSLAVLLLWIAAIAEVSGPLLISYFIDNMVAKSYLPLGLVAGLGVAYVGLQLTAASLHYAQSLLFNRAAVGVVQKLRTDVMDAALRQPLSEFDTQPVGQVISRVTNDTEVIRDLYVTVVATVLRSAALIGAMLVAMFSLNWRMALVAITIFPAVLIVMVIYQRYSTPIVRRVRAYLADINDGFNEVINGMSVIQQFRQQARFGERMGKPAGRTIWRACRRCDWTVSCCVRC